MKSAAIEEYLTWNSDVMRSAQEEDGFSEYADRWPNCRLSTPKEFSLKLHLGSLMTDYAGNFSGHFLLFPSLWSLPFQKVVPYRCRQNVSERDLLRLLFGHYSPSPP